MKNATLRLQIYSFEWQMNPLESYSLLCCVVKDTADSAK